MQDNLGNPFANSFEKSFNALMQLNMNTVQRMFSTNQEALMTVRRPEDLIETTVGLMVEQGQKNMEYVQNFFQICESHMLHVSLNDSKKTMKQVVKTMKPVVSSMAKSVATVSRPQKAKSRTVAPKKLLATSSMSTGQKSGVKPGKTSLKNNAHSSAKTSAIKTGSKSRTTVKK